jgi:transposase
MQTSPTLGIDLARLRFAVALRFDQQRLAKAEFDNTVAGFRKLRRWLQSHGVAAVPVAMESTSTYGEALAQWLHEAGHPVYVLNPERIACYARTLGQRNKTDPADAGTIAAFIATHEATRWLPPAPEQKTLRSLTRARHQLVSASTQLQLQLRTADAVARPHLQAVLTSLRRQLAVILQQIKAHLRSFPALAEQVRRLMSCKGVGLVTAATVLAELPPVTPQTEVRALCAWAGLTPRRWQSGNHEGPTRLSRKGNVYLRQALYMPALVAKRYNPLLRTFALRLAANGKTANAILGALSHKLLRILVGLLRSNRDFDPNWAPQKN